MFRFHVVQAEFGDCLMLEYGSPAQPRFTLIDGGPPNNYDTNLAPVLKDIAKQNTPLDLAVLSHVDNDHIVGLVDYFAELQAGAAGLPRPEELWHNSWGRAIDPQGVIAPRIVALMTLTRTAAMPTATNAVLGIKEGNALRTKAKQLNIPINAAFPNGDLITVGGAGGMEIMAGLVKLMTFLSGLKPGDPPVPRGFLGFEMDEKDSAVTVGAVLAKGPAAAAGLQTGDRIQEIDGVKIESIADVRRKASRLLPGQVWNVQVQRGDEQRELKITAGKGL